MAKRIKIQEGKEGRPCQETERNTIETSSRWSKTKVSQNQIIYFHQYYPLQHEIMPVTWLPSTSIEPASSEINCRILDTKTNEIIPQICYGPRQWTKPNDYRYHKNSFPPITALRTEDLKIQSFAYLVTYDKGANVNDVKFIKEINILK